MMGTSSKNMLRNSEKIRFPLCLWTCTLVKVDDLSVSVFHEEQSEV